MNITIHPSKVADGATVAGRNLVALVILSVFLFSRASFAAIWTEDYSSQTVGNALGAPWTGVSTGVTVGNGYVYTTASGGFAFRAATGLTKAEATISTDAAAGFPGAYLLFYQGTEQSKRAFARVLDNGGWLYLQVGFNGGVDVTQITLNKQSNYTNPIAVSIESLNGNDFTFSYKTTGDWTVAANKARSNSSLSSITPDTVGFYVEGANHGRVGTITAIPEPASLVMLGFGAVALLRRRR